MSHAEGFASTPHPPHPAGVSPPAPGRSLQSPPPASAEGMTLGSPEQKPSPRQSAPCLASKGHSSAVCWMDQKLEWCLLRICSTVDRSSLPSLGPSVSPRVRAPNQVPDPRTFVRTLELQQLRMQGRVSAGSHAMQRTVISS